jgi:hypothetical protein
LSRSAINAVVSVLREQASPPGRLRQPTSLARPHVDPESDGVEAEQGGDRQPPDRPRNRGRSGAARSRAFREEIGHGCDGLKPGWTRVNFSYFIAAAAAGYIAAAVGVIAAEGYWLLPAHRFDPHTGLWRHAGGPPRPQITLADVS